MNNTTIQSSTLHQISLVFPLHEAVTIRTQTILNYIHLNHTVSTTTTRYSTTQIKPSEKIRTIQPSRLSDYHTPNHVHVSPPKPHAIQPQTSNSSATTSILTISTTHTHSYTRAPAQPTQVHQDPTTSFSTTRTPNTYLNHNHTNTILTTPNHNPHPPSPPHPT